MSRSNGGGGAEMLARVIEDAPHAIAATEGAEHLLCRVNAAFCRLMGAAPEEVMGRPCGAVLARAAGEEALPLLDRVLRSGEPVKEHEVTARGAGDPRAPWSFTVWPLRDAAGAPLGLVVEVRERSPEAASMHRLEGMAEEMREIREKLLCSAQREQAWAEKAEAAARAKSDFLAMMSHELRTPLSGIVGYTEVLIGGMLGPLGESQREGLQRISTCSQHLVALIEEVLSFAQLEAQTLPVSAVPFDVCEVARSAAVVIEPLALQKGLDLRIDLPDAPLPVESDAHKVRQILLNLLGNAVKFTDAGEVRLQVREERGRVHLLVRDTGIGIPAPDLERIFEPFVQAEPVMTRQFGGTGLGLSISRNLTSLLGGVLRAESTPGSGSTFAVELPRVAPSASLPG